MLDKAVPYDSSESIILGRRVIEAGILSDMVHGVPRVIATHGAPDEHRAWCLNTPERLRLGFLSFFFSSLFAAAC